MKNTIIWINKAKHNFRAESLFLLHIQNLSHNFRSRKTTFDIFHNVASNFIYSYCHNKKTRHNSYQHFSERHPTFTLNYKNVENLSHVETSLNFLLIFAKKKEKEIKTPLSLSLFQWHGLSNDTVATIDLFRAAKWSRTKIAKLRVGNPLQRAYLIPRGIC